jgi:hypothetical protein
MEEKEKIKRMVSQRKKMAIPSDGKRGERKRVSSE